MNINIFILSIYRKISQTKKKILRRYLKNKT